MRRLFNELLPLTIGTFLITFMAIVSLVRFLWNIPMTVGSVFLPGWTGGIFFILAGLLVAWMSKCLQKLLYTLKGL